MNPLISSINNANPLQIIQMLKSGNTDDLLQTLYNINPQFRKFYDENKGKSITQICRQYNISDDTLYRLVGQ